LEAFMKKMLTGGAALLSLLVMTALAGCSNEPPGLPLGLTGKVTITGMPSSGADRVSFIMVLADNGFDTAGCAGAAVVGGKFAPEVEGEEIKDGVATVTLYDSQDIMAWLVPLQLGETPEETPSEPKKIGGTGNVTVMYAKGDDSMNLSTRDFSSVSFNEETITLNWSSGVDVGPSP
jgi:hypothetical protein